MTITDDGIAVVDGDAWLSKQIRDEHRLDVHHARVIVDLMQRFIPVGGTVCDIGACLGDHTVAYADLVGPDGHVYAFEPNPTAFECLTYNLRDKPWVLNYQMALADHESRCEIGPEPYNLDNLGMWTIYRESSDAPVVMTTLDMIAKDWTRLDFVKIDVEGVEHALLSGAVQTITKWKPPMLIEINRWALSNHGATPHDVFTQLDRLGYVMMPICLEDATMDPYIRINEDEVDVVCIQRDHEMANGFLRLTEAN